MVLSICSNTNCAAGFQVCRQLTPLCLSNVNSSGQTAQCKCHENQFACPVEETPAERMLKFQLRRNLLSLAVSPTACIID